MAKIELEAGMVYERQGQLFLAVRPNLLISCNGGQWVEQRPFFRYRAQREMSVAALRQSWGVGLAEFNARVGPYFQPESEGLRQDGSSRRSSGSSPGSSPGSPRSRAWGEPHWQAFRTHRHALDHSRLAG